LSAYVQRTALSNQRILRDQDGRITFSYVESATGLTKTCTVSADEFLRRVLQHVLPKGFHKVRYFGWLHPRARSRFLRVQTLLAVPLIFQEPAPKPPALHRQCPQCRKFTLEAIVHIKPRPP
jgi:hypothetical protein